MSKTKNSSTKATSKKSRTMAVIAAAVLVIVLIILFVRLGGHPNDGMLDSNKVYTASIDIADYGTITVQLNQKEAPITCANFVKLAESGFYNGLTFHRIMEGFMMQGVTQREPAAAAQITPSRASSVPTV